MRRALFLDRDGILNRVVHRDGIVSSPRRFAEFEILDGAKRLVETGRDAGFLNLVVTNQPDLSRGLLDPADLERMHVLLLASCPVHDIEVCGSGDNADRRRKPNPGMILDAAAKWSVDLATSWFIGDSIKDLEAARKAGVRSILLETDYNAAHHGKGDQNFSSLEEIAGFIKGATP